MKLLAIFLFALVAVASAQINTDDDDPQMPKSNGTLHYSPQLVFLLDAYYDGMPHSYMVPPKYWRSDLYLGPGLHPLPLDSQVAIEDRVATTHGLNLYDASTWEIALALRGEIELPGVYERSILYSSSTGTNLDVGGLADIRSDTPLFFYGPSETPGNALQMVELPTNFTNPNDGSDRMPGALFFRMITSNYLIADPLLGSYARAFRYPDPDSNGPSWNTAGVIVWNDWKPILGENVWMGMLGPIQQLYIAYNGTLPTFEGFEQLPDELKFSLSVMPGLKALTSPEGSMYHCPRGTMMYPADENEATNVSNENNVSALAAFRMLHFVLKNNTNSSGSDLQQDIEDLEELIEGLENWFIKYGLTPPINGTSNRVFWQGGHVNFTGGFFPVPLADGQGFAVDCQTWGIAVLGGEFIDTKIASEQGASFKIWQQTKAFGGYYTGKNMTGTLGGVGYSIHPQHDVVSSEWSWGAVLAVRELAAYYRKVGCGQCGQWASSLEADEKSMIQFLQQPYPTGMYDNTTGGYMYANKRYFIPWGWYANAIPSTCSTAWAVMTEHKFNPFTLGGGPHALFYNNQNGNLLSPPDVWVPPKNATIAPPQPTPRLF